MNELEGFVREFSPHPQQLKLPMSEIYRTMGYGETLPEDNIIKLCESLTWEACSIARPKARFQINSSQLNDDFLRVDKQMFGVGRTIAVLMRNSVYGLVFVATVGEEFQAWMDAKSKDGDILESFIIDAIGSCLVEATGDYMEEELKSILAEISPDIKHTNRFSPGYCGWDIEEQQALFSFLQNQTCGITLNSSSLMHPTKSISGVIGIGREVVTKKYGCDLCRKSSCYMRRAK